MPKKKSVSFVHVSDSHLGHFRFPKSDVNGVNQRMMDFHNAFLQSIDKAIAQEPDFIIHSGDIIDSYNPPNRSREVMAEGLSRLHAACIPTVVLSGTHDTPKTRRDINAFNLFKYSNIYMITEPDRIDMEINDNKVCVYGIPYSFDFDEMKSWIDTTLHEELDKDAFNILVLHCDIAGVDKLKYSSHLITLPDNIGDRYDYVALGHFHSYYKWNDKKNVIFAGATERKNFDEVGEDRYIHKVILDKKSGADISSVVLDIRPMVKLVVDLREVSDVETAYKSIKKSAKKEKECYVDGVMLSIVLQCKFDLWKGLNISYIKNMFGNAFWVDPVREKTEDVVVNNMSLNIAGSITNEWGKWIDKSKEDKEMKKWYFESGKRFLERAIENDTNKIEG